MRALVANDYGPPSQLAIAEVGDPEPSAGQVLVAIEAAALNPLDLKQVTGAVRELYPIELPYVPGMDGAGRIVAAGAEVERFSPGDEVFGFFGQTPGTIAEYAVISDGPYLAGRPPGLDVVSAAGIPSSGLTALSLVRAAKLGAGQTLLVIGASGGIGMFVVQLAVHDGAGVLATAGPEDRDYLRRLGAGATLDYRGADVIKETLGLHPGGVDVVLDLINMGPSLSGSVRAVHPGGRLVSPLAGPDAAALGREDITVIYTGLGSNRKPGDLEELGAQVAGGTLKVEIGGTYEFEDATQAFVDFAAKHTRGKLVVTV